MKTSVLRKRRKSSSPTRRRVRDGQPHDRGRRRREDRARPRSKSRPARRRLLSVLDEVYRRSLEEPEAFWADAAAAIDWDEPWERVLDDSRAPFFRWFAGGRMNTPLNPLHPRLEPGSGHPTGPIFPPPGSRTPPALTHAGQRSAAAPRVVSRLAP